MLDFTPKFNSHVGLRYTDSLGLTVVCWQLLNDDKYSIADAEFVDGRLERFRASRKLGERAFDWIAHLTAPLGFVESLGQVNRARRLVELL